MSKNVAGDADARHNAAREAHRVGMSASETGPNSVTSRSVNER
jgi:hypothetical protein